jgi:CO dehydrogenase/acetyl-CoA synthase epsilon subunit
MTDLDKVIDRVVKLRASLNIDLTALTTADKRLLRAHVEHCTLDLQQLLAQLIAPSDALLDGAGGQDITIMFK